MDNGRYYSVNVPLRDGIDDHGECKHSYCTKYGLIHLGDIFLITMSSYRYIPLTIVKK